MTCNEYIDCPASPSAPLTGYNAQSNETILFKGRGFGPVVPPPLNWNFTLTSAYATATSGISQQAADAAAQAAATFSAEQTWSMPGVPIPVMPGSELVFWENSQPII
jgi:hypothetical protein